MQTRDMVRMANQIAEFFEPYPHAEAVDAIAKHIHASWDPRMRNKLKQHMDAGAEGLSPVFISAATEYFAGPKSPVKATETARK